MKKDVRIPNNEVYIGVGNLILISETMKIYGKTVKAFAMIIRICLKTG
jgi:hypothetical protein